MCSIIRFFTILLFLTLSNATKYLLVPNEETIVTDCEGEEDHSVTKAFDMSNLTFNFVSDDEVVVNGYTKIIADIKANDTIWLSGEIFKEVRGQYILPAVEAKRNDICKAAFDPKEVWYPHLSKLDKKYQVCPVTGTIYGISNWSSKAGYIELPNSRFHGAYRSFIRFGLQPNPEPQLCAVFDFRLVLV